jgi:hypothetical protein
MAVKGYAFITSSGYDPEKGKLIKDPYLGDVPTLGACMPNIRRRVVPGDHIFVISGKIPGVPQYIVGGFEVAEKITALAAYRRFPELRLRRLDDGQLTGNIIVDARGNQHPLDTHSSFEERIQNYIVGRNPIALTAPHEIAQGREETLAVLRSVLRKNGPAPFNILGRGGSRLDYKQVLELRDWLLSLKSMYKRKAS